MDTETVNRIITEITNRLGVGYSVFSDAVSQYAQVKAIESLIFSVALFCVAILPIAIYFFAVWRNSFMNSEDKVFAGCFFAIIFAVIIIAAIYNLTNYFN